MADTENQTPISEQDVLMLLDVFMAARLVLAVKARPKNPFVRQLGKEPITFEAALNLLQDAVNKAGSISDAIDELEAERVRAEMNAIDAEEDTFDEEE